MCLHSQAKSHPKMSLKDGIKKDIARAIANVSLPSDFLDHYYVDTLSSEYKKASWNTLRSLIRPQQARLSSHLHHTNK